MTQPKPYEKCCDNFLVLRQESHICLEALWNIVSIRKFFKNTVKNTVIIKNDPI